MGSGSAQQRWRIAARPGHETYFRTQITRTTAAFASVDVPFAVTAFAFRKSRTVSADTITACDAGTDVAGPATLPGFNSA